MLFVEGEELTDGLIVDEGVGFWVYGTEGEALEIEAGGAGDDEELGVGDTEGTEFVLPIAYTIPVWSATKRSPL